MGRNNQEQNLGMILIWSLVLLLLSLSIFQDFNSECECFIKCTEGPQKGKGVKGYVNICALLTTV